MSRLTLGELYDFVKEAVEVKGLSRDTDVIALGEYDYGMTLGKPRITEMSYLEERDIVKDTATVLAINLDTYLYECEDLGYAYMWVEPGEANSLKEEWAEEDEGDE